MADPPPSPPWTATEAAVARAMAKAAGLFYDEPGELAANSAPLPPPAWPAAGSTPPQGAPSSSSGGAGGAGGNAGGGAAALARLLQQRQQPQQLMYTGAYEQVDSPAAPAGGSPERPSGSRSPGVGGPELPEQPAAVESEQPGEGTDKQQVGS